MAVPERAHRAPQTLITNSGAYIPFPATRAEREKTGDPRLSIEERYSGRADYLSKVEQVAKRLAEERYILPEDVPAVVAEAGKHWDWRMTEPRRGSRSSPLRPASGRDLQYRPRHGRCPARPSPPPESGSAVEAIFGARRRCLECEPRGDCEVRRWRSSFDG